MQGSSLPLKRITWMRSPGLQAALGSLRSFSIYGRLQPSIRPAAVGIHLPDPLGFGPRWTRSTSPSVGRIGDGTDLPLQWEKLQTSQKPASAGCRQAKKSRVRERRLKRTAVGGTDTSRPTAF